MLKRLKEIPACAVDRTEWTKRQAHFSFFDGGYRCFESQHKKNFFFGKPRVISYILLYEIYRELRTKNKHQQPQTGAAYHRKKKPSPADDEQSMVIIHTKCLLNTNIIWCKQELIQRIFSFSSKRLSIISHSFWCGFSSCLEKKVTFFIQCYEKSFSIILNSSWAWIVTSIFMLPELLRRLWFPNRCFTW